MDAAKLREFATKYTAAWCSQDAASVASFFAENGSLKINEGNPSIGRTAITAAAQGFMTAFPDMVVRMAELSLDGGDVVYRWTLTGTNTGPGGTGRAVRISGYEEWTIGADGLIAESKGHFDEADYQRQLATEQQAAQRRMAALRHLPVPGFLYGTAWKEARTQALTELALRVGFRGVDTANQRRHYVEAAVGPALGAAYRSGLVTRGDLFLQTKFTYRDGQDHRLPYDPAADLSTQVAQSIASSLEHLGTDYLDSYLLHGPASGRGWTADDVVVWAAMLNERDAGRIRFVGVSNVSRRHLEQLEASGAEIPAFVQNRCFARTGWDREVRSFCRDRRVTYQGFSLLTANPEVLRHRLVAGIAARLGATPAQVLFRFALAVGILPLTGTSDPTHMKQDLASRELALSPDEVAAIESIAG